MSTPFVIVGAGLAAAKAVESLRDAGYLGPIVVYGNERHLPYERPPLSKGYLMGDVELAAAFVHPPDWYAERDIDLRLGTTVTAVDLAGRHVVAGEVTQPYHKLLLATGSSPRRLPLAEDSGAPVAYLRTIEDSDRIKASFVPEARIVIIGGGWIGLEVAAAARNAGTEVTLLETLELPLLRVLGHEVAEVFATLHRAHGVDLRLGGTLSAIERVDDGAVVRFGDGSGVDANLVVIGVGATPNTALAEAAGLTTDDGIVVDQYLSTSDPDVFAAGDVACAHHPALGRRIRVEHWDNAIEQGVVAARNMLGEGVAYDRLPYFYTDQYDLGMEYVGHVGPDGYDAVVLRGDPSDRQVFSAFWMRQGKVCAGMHANDWDAIEPIRRIVGRQIDPVRLREASVALADIAELG